MVIGIDVATAVVAVSSATEAREDPRRVEAYRAPIRGIRAIPLNVMALIWSKRPAGETRNRVPDMVGAGRRARVANGVIEAFRGRGADRRGRKEESGYECRGGIAASCGSGETMSEGSAKRNVAQS